MVAVAADITSDYPTGSSWWVFVQDERAFTDFGCGWRRLTIEKMGHKWVKLSGYGRSKRVQRGAFFALRPKPNLFGDTTDD